MGNGGGLQRQAKACPYRYKAGRGRVRGGSVREGERISVEGKGGEGEDGGKAKEGRKGGGSLSNPGQGERN